MISPFVWLVGFIYVPALSVLLVGGNVFGGFDHFLVLAENDIVVDLIELEFIASVLHQVFL